MSYSRVALATAFAAALLPSPAGADDQEAVSGWATTAELSLVSTGGNSESDTVGLSMTLVRTMPEARFTLDAHGLRAESTTRQRTAIGPSPDDFTLGESSSSLLTAENYSLAGRYHHEVSAALFWFIGLRWERNEFAGFSQRVTAVGGLGTSWWENDRSHLRTDYGLTYTTQDDLQPIPGRDDTFLGARLSYDFEHSLTPTTTFASLLTVDQNLDETSDLRADLTNSLAVSISRRLALKVSLQALYDNLPAQGVVPLEFPAGVPTGELARFVLDTTDTVLTTALVVTF